MAIVKVKLVNRVWELDWSETAEVLKMSWKTFKFFDKEVLKDPETKQPYQDLAVRARVWSAQEGAPWHWRHLVQHNTLLLD